MSGTAQTARRAVFLDRDGVLNESVVRNGKPYPPASPADLRIIPGTQEALERLKERGFLLIVVTNQPDVGRGNQSHAAVEEMHQHLRRELPLDDVLACFHDDADRCDCRKPLPGLLTRAAQQFEVDLSRSYLVGDRWRDIDAGAAAGCKTIWVDRGYQERSSTTPSDARVRSLGEGVDWIVRQEDNAAAMPTASSPTVRGLALSLFIALAGIYLFLSPGSVAGSGYTSEEMESGLRMMSMVTAISKGRPVPPMLWSRHGPTPVLFDLPFLKVGKVFLTPDLALSFEPVLLTAALMAIVFLWLRKICSPLTALFVTLAGAFGTMLWPYAYMGLETKQSFFVLLAGYLGVARGKILGWPRLILFALICALALTVKSTGAVMWPAIAYLFYVQFRDDWRYRWGQLATMSIIVVAMCAVNVVLRNFYWDPLGGSSVVLKGWLVQSGFQIFTNLIGLFGSPAKGLFVFAPILIATLWAVPRTFQAHRDAAVFATLILACTIGFLSILNFTSDETWGSRYLHVTIAPLLICVGAAWPALRWRVHLPLAVLALVGIVISFLGSFFYYGVRGKVSDAAVQNTMEWLTSDPVWNEVAFDARLFQIWWKGSSEPAPWTPTHLWIWSPPPNVPAWPNIDLRPFAETQSFVFQQRHRKREPKHESLFRFYWSALAVGLLMLARTVWVSLRTGKLQRSSLVYGLKWKIASGLAGLVIVGAGGAWIARPVVAKPRLMLDKNEVLAGKGDYTLKVAAMPNENLLVRYSVDGSAPGEMTVSLDSRGAVHFNVGAETPKGVYRMLAFKRQKDPDWFSADASITVK